MTAARPTYYNLVHDSRRWDDFEFRDGDIVITTPPKCGTTWMQRICSVLVFQNTELDASLSAISPWLDMLTVKREVIFETLERQGHRRFIKTHTPLDGLPWDERVHYLCVGRDPRDVGVSWYNHQMNVDVEALLAVRDEVRGNDDLPEVMAADPPYSGTTLEERFWEWVDHPAIPTRASSSLWGTLQHLEECVRHRDRPNVHLFHYANMKADLEGEMRRLSGLLGIDVDEDRFRGLVDAATFERMKATADRVAPSVDSGVWKENSQFFHSGRGGAWRDFFDDAAKTRYDERVAELTTPEVADWAHAVGVTAGA